MSLYPGAPPTTTTPNNSSWNFSSGPSGYSPPPLNLNVENQPQIDQSYGDWRTYASQLGNNADVYNRNSMASMRDAVSGMAREAEGGSIGRGLYGSGVGAQIRSNVFTGGLRSLAGLNANNTSDARRQQMQALQGQTTAAIGQGAYQTGQGNLAVNAWQAQQQAYNQQAQLAMQQQQNFWNQQMQLLNGYGFGGGSSYGGGGFGGYYGGGSGIPLLGAA